MPSLLTLGKQRVKAGLDDKDCLGVSLVIPSTKVDRIELVAWAIDACAQNPDPKKNSFRAMYVADQQALASLVQERVRKHRRDKRYVSDGMFEVKGARLPSLRVLNYTTTRMLIKAANRFPVDSLEMLVVDERGHDGSSKRLMPFVERANPLFTLVLTSSGPPTDWPWHYLGPPLVLGGPAQAPPANRIRVK